MDTNMDDFREYLEAVSNDFTRLLNSGLKEETIVLLLHDSTKVSKTNIRLVLKAAKELKAKYLTAKIKSGRPDPLPPSGPGRKVTTL